MSDKPDVDIDVADPTVAIDLFKNRAVRASQVTEKISIRNGREVIDKFSDIHISGIYLQKIPVNPLINSSKIAVFPYKEAEALGYYKLDILGNNVYRNFNSMEEMRQLLKEPVDWNWFKNDKFVKNLFHFGGYVSDKQTVAQMVAEYAPQSIPDLACMLAIIRPAKKHLIGKSWDTIRSQIWQKSTEKDSGFKKSHSHSYAMVVALDARLQAPKFFATVEP